MILFRRLLIPLAAMAAASPAMAQDASECACVTAYQGVGAPTGSVVSSEGDVKISQAAGYSDATTNSPLSFGSRIVVGAQSAARLKVGADCNVSVGQNSMADISRIGDNICVRVRTPETTASFGLDGNTRFGAPEIIFGLAAGASFAGFVFDDKEDSACVSGPC
jgi:hypothetical protein